MNCHYCSREATYDVKAGGVRVGLCEDHFRERLEELANADSLEEITERVDVERAE